MTFKKYSNRLKLTVSGDQAAAKDPVAIGTARQQLALLKQAIGFQALPQGKLRKIYPNGMIISTRHVFGQDLVHIHIPPQVIETIEIPEILGIYTPPVIHLLVCCGNSMKILTIRLEEDSPPFSIGSSSLGRIDFVEGPRLYGTFSDYEEDISSISQGEAAGTIVLCQRQHYAHKYQVEGIRSQFKLTQFSDALPIYGPADYSPASDKSCDEAGVSQTWSKTYDDLTITAYTYEYSGFTYWGLMAAFQGQRVQFGDGDYVWDGYMREGVRGTYFIGFDLWMENGIYFVSTCSALGYTVEVFRLTGTVLNRVEVHAATPPAAQQDLFWGKSSKLVGLWERSAYVLTPYFLFKVDSGVGKVWETAPPYGGYETLIWNHADGTYDLVFAPAPYSTAAETYCYSYYGYAYTHYSSVYCTIYDDGSYNGEACASRSFLGKTKNGIAYVSPSVFCDEPAEMPYWDTINAQPNSFTWTVDWVVVETSATVAILGTYVIGKLQIDLGQLRYPFGAFLRYKVSPSGSYQYEGGYPNSEGCKPENAKELNFLRAIFDVAGGSAGEYEIAHYTGDSATREDVPVSCILEDFQDLYFGDTDLAEISSGFPYDFTWRAVLKHGIDCADAPVSAPAVLYKGFIKLANGKKIFSENYGDYRGMFLRYPLNKICEEAT